MLAIGAAAAAQTFVVDASNGPGANFTDLPTAVAAVPDGAVLDVRPGSYAAFTIVNKGLSVLFRPGAMVSSAATVAVSVTGTSPQQTVVLRGMVVDPLLGGQILCTNCLGLVSLANCTSTNRTGPLLVVSNCSQVEATRCTLGDFTTTMVGAELDHSSVVFRTSQIAGGSPYALRAIAGQLQLVDTAVGGFPIYSILTGIELQGGDLRMVGGSASSFFNYAISGTGTARIDPSVVLTGSTLGGVAQISPAVQASSLSMPAVTATDGPLGGSLTVDLRGPAGDFGALLAGLPGPPLAFPGIADPSWMLPGTEVVCATAILAAGTRLSITVPVPNVAALRGTRIVWQGASFGAANGLQASNPAVTTHW
jgi:hypothetical protein